MKIGEWCRFPQRYSFYFRDYPFPLKCALKMAAHELVLDKEGQQAKLMTGSGSAATCQTIYEIFLRDRVLLCHPGWSAVVCSKLTAVSNSWVQVILPPKPLK